MRAAALPQPAPVDEDPRIKRNHPPRRLQRHSRWRAELAIIVGGACLAALILTYLLS